MTNPAYSGAPTSIQPGVLQSPANYSYPITSGLLSGLAPPPQGSIPQGGPWSQLAYQMAGSPKQGGMYAPVATPAAPPGASSSSASSLAGLLPLLGGLLGTSGGTSGLNSIVNALGGLLGGSNQLPLLNSAGAPITGSAADTGSLGGGSINQGTLTGADTGSPGSGLDFSTGNIDLSGSAPDENTGDLDSLLQSLGFSGAGGQAATPSSDVLSEVQSPGVDMPIGGSSPSSLASLPTSSILGNAAGLLGVGQGIASGTPTGYASAGLGATSLAAKNGLLGDASGAAGQAANSSLSALGLYQGLQQGGLTGDATAAANAAKLAGTLGSATGLLSSGAGQALSAAGSYIAAPLALYNLANNWQSGATGSDALQGASAGAAIGSIVPGIGNLIGGLIGGAAGALSSAFGGGKQDPETQNTYAVNAAGTNAASTLSPTQSFQYLAGVMDGKNNTAGHSTALEQTFGRMGETGVLNGMTSQINSAIGSGAITPTANGGVAFKTGGGTVIYNAQDAPQQIMSQIIQPWLTSQGVSADSLTFTDAKGNSSGNNLQQALTNLISAYMGGQLTSSTAIGTTGQMDTTLPTYAGSK